MWLSVLFHMLLYILSSVQSDIWELYLLGTRGCFPTPTHALSTTAMRFPNGEVFLFDAGEGTQVQLMKSVLTIKSVTRIFITHLHGDHYYGLPGLISTMSTYSKQGMLLDKPTAELNLESDPIVNIYGPAGLRSILAHTTPNNLGFHCNVHELKVPSHMFPRTLSNQHVIDDAFAKRNTELHGSDIYDNHDNVWNLYEDDYISIKAGLITHTVPTFGYVIHEKDRLGTLDLGKLQKYGVGPGPACRLIKEGKPFQAKNGKFISASEVLGPTIPGRKVTILGDTSNASSIKNIAKHSDVVVHEVTFLNKDLMKARRAKHSTPYQAALFAKQCKAKTLILSHFSQRYSARAWYEESLLEKETQESLRSLQYPCEVKLAKELLLVVVKRNLRKEIRKLKKLNRKYRIRKDSS